jgi:hypothetical protein
VFLRRHLGIVGPADTRIIVIERLPAGEVSVMRPKQVFAITQEWRLWSRMLSGWTMRKGRSQVRKAEEEPKAPTFFL